MPYSIVIDGYNFLHAQVRGRLRQRPDALRAAREHLIRWLENRLPNPGDVLIVFDSKPGENPVPDSTSIKARIAIAFATNFATADEYILDYCQRQPPGSVTVVTNDRVIQKEARRLRMRWTSCEEFALCLVPLPTPAPRERKQTLPEKPTATPAEEIDQWLRDFGLPPEIAIPIDSVIKPAAPSGHPTKRAYPPSPDDPAQHNEDPAGQGHPSGITESPGSTAAPTPSVPRFHGRTYAQRPPVNPGPPRRETAPGRGMGRLLRGNEASRSDRVMIRLARGSGFLH